MPAYTGVLWRLKQYDFMFNFLILHTKITAFGFKLPYVFSLGKGVVEEKKIARLFFSSLNSVELGKRTRNLSSLYAIPLATFSSSNVITWAESFLRYVQDMNGQRSFSTWFGYCSVERLGSHLRWTHTKLMTLYPIRETDLENSRNIWLKFLLSGQS